MFRSKLLKVMAFGLCMSALISGTAFAQSIEGSAPTSRGELSSEDKALFDKQLEIDRYLFADHVKEIEEKGIIVSYTGVADTYVEIGISPYTDKNTNYLYELFGKDIVKVVKAEQAVLDAKAETNAAVSDLAEDEQIFTTMAIDADTAVSDTAVEDTLQEEKVYKGGDDKEFQIQIESVNEGEELENPEVIYQTTAADAGQEIAEVQTVSATDDRSADVKRTEDGEDKGLSTPITILLIAGGAAIVGGAIIITSKKKAER